MRQTRTHTMTLGSAPLQVPMLDASDLPGDEDWAVLESLRFDHGAAVETDPDAYRFEDVNVVRGAFE